MWRGSCASRCLPCQVVRFSFHYLGVRGIDVLEGRLRCHAYECSNACGAMPRRVTRETSGTNVDRRTKSRDITNIAVLRYLQVAQRAVVAHMRRITTLQQCALDSANHAQTHAASTGKLDAEEHLCLRAWYNNSDFLWPLRVRVDFKLFACMGDAKG